MSNADLAGFIKRNPLKMICGLLALLSVAGIYWVHGRIDASGTLLQEKIVEGGRLAQNIRNAAQLPEQLDTLSAAGTKIQSRLVRASQLATNLQYFYRLEADSGVELIDLRQTTSGESGKGAAQKTTQGVGFSLSFKGDYLALLNCLRRLENGAHYCRVLSAGIGGISTDRTAPLTLNLSIELLGHP